MESMEIKKSNEPLNKNLALICGTIIVLCLIVVVVLYSKPSFSNGNNTVVNGKPIQQQQAQQQGQNQPTGPVKVSVDDDAVLGNKNAPLTMIEFSDYECPFCKRSFDQVLPELKKNYIDTGKVKLVYRDLPLSFHANAHKEAEAAECARNQGNDTTYFKFHDAIFTQTTSNGTGLALTQLPVIAKSLGLNVSQFLQCLDSGKFKGEVDKDLADAAKVGANGTPTYFIGKSSQDGLIDGTIIVGAQPYSAFKVIIDEELKKLGK